MEWYKEKGVGFFNSTSVTKSLQAKPKARASGGSRQAGERKETMTVLMSTTGRGHSTPTG